MLRNFSTKSKRRVIKCWLKTLSTSKFAIKNARLIKKNLSLKSKMNQTFSLCRGSMPPMRRRLRDNPSSMTIIWSQNLAMLPYVKNSLVMSKTRKKTTKWPVWMTNKLTRSLQKGLTVSNSNLARSLLVWRNLRSIPKSNSRKAPSRFRKTAVPSRNL